MENLVEILMKKNYTISTAESLTAGMIASTICNISGASNVFKGGIVSYTKEAKNLLLNIPLSKIEEYGVYSKETAYNMASSIKNKLDSNVALSTTGVAGPGSDENVEAGTIFYCIIINDKTYLDVLHLTGTRNEVREKGTSIILDKLIGLLNNI